MTDPPGLRPWRSWWHGRYARPRGQPAPTAAPRGLCEGVKLGKAELQKGAKVCGSCKAT